MNKKQLKRLAKWYGYEFDKVIDMDFQIELYKGKIVEEVNKSEFIDLLEDKMIREFRDKYSSHRGYIESRLSYIGKKVQYAIFFIGKKDIGTWGPLVEGEGKNKDEVRANAIMNYLERWK